MELVFSIFVDGLLIECQVGNDLLSKLQSSWYVGLCSLMCCSEDVP